MRRPLCGPAAFALYCSSLEAAAEPDRWSQARDPRAATEYRALVRAERQRFPFEEELDGGVLARKLAERALVMQELGGGVQVKDPRLRVLLGDAMVTAGAPRHVEGRRVLLRVLEQPLSEPLAAVAWAGIAFASREIGDRDAEMGAYEHALSLEWRSSRRFALLRARAESAMLSGDAAGAVTDLELARHVAGPGEEQAISDWALAVALERALDLPRAVAAMTRAQSFQFDRAGESFSVLDLPETETFPSYDALYYAALGGMLKAGRHPAGAAALHLSRAIDDFTAYLAAAPVSDPWRMHAKRNLVWCQRQAPDVSRH